MASSGGGGRSITDFFTGLWPLHKAGAAASQENVKRKVDQGASGLPRNAAEKNVAQGQGVTSLPHSTAERNVAQGLRDLAHNTAERNVAQSVAGLPRNAVERNVTQGVNSLPQSTGERNVAQGVTGLPRNTAERNVAQHVVGLPRNTAERNVAQGVAGLPRNAAERNVAQGVAGLPHNATERNVAQNVVGLPRNTAERNVAQGVAGLPRNAAERNGVQVQQTNAPRNLSAIGLGAIPANLARRQPADNLVQPGRHLAREDLGSQHGMASRLVEEGDWRGHGKRDNVRGRGQAYQPRGRGGRGRPRNNNEDWRRGRDVHEQEPGLHRQRGEQGQRRNARDQTDLQYENNQRPLQNRDGPKHERGGGYDNGNQNIPHINDRNKGRANVREMGYKRLEELADKDPSEIVLIVANSRSGFPDLLKGDLRPDILVLIVKVLAKVCQVDFVENKAGVLSTACNSKFLDNLTLHLTKVLFDNDPRRKAGLKEFFPNLLSFYETVLDLLPSTACEYLHVALMTTTMVIQTAATIHRITFDEHLTLKLKELEHQLNVLIAERDKKQVKETSRNEVLKYQPPPDDFRDLTIFPTSTDILSRDKAFIRPNIIEGAYTSVEHYLDVQFRLLREDFVWPLRSGITEYVSQLNQKQKKKTENIRIYHKVQFKTVKVVSDRMGLVLSFETKNKIKWEYSKRFMFGSLLCFTKDNFKTILFGTVLDRDVKELEKGLIVVGLSEGSEITDEIFQSEYIMAESEVYFEPYYHVLKALQKMKRRDFPMSQYIVSVQPQTKPPQYVLDMPNFPWFIEGHKVPVLVEAAWPTECQLKLDESQLKAFKSALTKEFVVIQGPPGTGKTYLGLKIAKALLLNVGKLLDAPRVQRNNPYDNYNYSDSDSDYEEAGEVDRRQSPMLVVCFTNHALDQFLEGLITTTKNIIRVGGQSKSETLKPFNLKDKRFENKKHRGNAVWLSRDIRDRMTSLMSRIKGIQEDMSRLDGGAGIVSVTCIADVYKHDNLNCFMDDSGKLSNIMLIDWLLLGSEDFQPPPEVGVPRMEPGADDELPIGALEFAMEIEDDDDDHKNAYMDNDYELGDLKADVKLGFTLLFQSMTERVKDLVKEIETIRSQVQPGQDMIFDRTWALETELEELKFKICYFTHCLTAQPHGGPNGALLLQQHVNMWDLNHNQRWDIYRSWVGQLRMAMLEDLRRIETDYRTEARQFEETKQMEDLELMLKAHVVGMTTTCAARLQPLLQALKPRIVIVEEAAEVMESHIIVSLTSHCQHLILIGDHQQLRPTTAVYRLAQDYHFDISLFERMLKNGLHCDTINVQHRMRPEIASLIVPSIYETLHNHESVFEYKKIRGVVKSVFFFTHENHEEMVGETSSKRNVFEGDMILALCRYLLLQGYSPERITILTTYSGQMFYLRKERQKYSSLKDVQITIVDNFQGEENDIILLSLVRNNKDNNVGFLNIENRVCVALSRAKHGMFIMGNMNNLTARNKVWPKIKVALDKLGAVGETLTLRCEIHRDQLTKVRCADDFNQVPEGGCRLLCDTEIPCGHRCKSVCHAQDREHKNYKCHEPCTRIPDGCILEHACPGKCYADCGRCEVPVTRALPCDHTKTLPCYVEYLAYKCHQNVSVTAADCGHTFDKPCHRDMDTYPCPFPCNARLDCGHTCAFTCHVANDPDHLNYKCQKTCTKTNAGCSLNHPCSRRCHEDCSTCLMSVKKRPPSCDHLYTVQCSLDPATIQCLRPCKRTLPCGHPCKMQCCQPCGNCDVKVKKKVAECGHEVQVKCSEEARREHCKGPCQRNMACGHRCKRACKVECASSDTCTELVPSRVIPICGHQIKVPCYLAAQDLPRDSAVLLSYCRQPCGAQLACEHGCVGSCGECLQGRIHRGCEAKCARPLICSHACEVPCTRACPPCKQKCRFRCVHNVCTKPCGMPCTTCKEDCPWQCEHLKCSMRCGEMCNREPCYEPCKKRQPCGHPCIGFCGEPCPPLCRVCNEEEVTTTFLGYEDEDDARFVYLVDCKHTIESQGLEGWLDMERNEITVPKCPLCKSDIMTTLRFMNRIKQVFKDICSVKTKVYGEMKAIENSRSELVMKLHRIDQASSGRVTKEGKELIQKFLLKLKPVDQKRKQYINAVDVQLLDLQMDIFSELQQLYCDTFQKAKGASMQTLTQYLDLLLSALSKRNQMSQQEVSDFNLEICRFGRIAELCQLEATMNLQPKTPTILQYHDSARNVALSIHKYSQGQDHLLVVNLKKLAEALKSTCKISDQERKDIVKAIGLSQGHWFKCPKGHIYAIGECGGAMQESKCPECGSAIGGSSHRLLSDNRLATEMDGAVRSAWPGTAMMP